VRPIPHVVNKFGGRLWTGYRYRRGGNAGESPNITQTTRPLVDFADAESHEAHLNLTLVEGAEMV